MTCRLCSRPALARELCATHYHSARKAGWLDRVAAPRQSRRPALTCTWRKRTLRPGARWPFSLVRVSWLARRLGCSRDTVLRRYPTVEVFQSGRRLGIGIPRRLIEEVTQ